MKFFGEQWMATDYSNLLNNKSIYILLQNDFFMYHDGIWQTVDTLTCCHEDADTRMLLFAKHARDDGAAKLVIHTSDIDVFILMLRFLGEIGELYMKTWKGNKKHVLKVDAVKKQIEQELAGDIKINKFWAALPGLHAFTGYDSVSEFAGKGKAKCFNLLRKDLEFVKSLESLGENWNVTEEVVDKMERFCCSLYGGGRETNISNCDTRSTVQKEENLNVSSCLHVNRPWWRIFEELIMKLVFGRCHESTTTTSFL